MERHGGLRQSELFHETHKKSHLSSFLFGLAGRRSHERTLFVDKKSFEHTRKFTRLAPPNNCNKTRLSAQTAVEWAGKEALVIFLLRDDGYMLRVNKLFRKICLALAPNVFLSLAKVSCYSFAAFSVLRQKRCFRVSEAMLEKEEGSWKRVGKRMKAQ